MFWSCSLQANSPSHKEQKSPADLQFHTQPKGPCFCPWLWVLFWHTASMFSAKPSQVISPESMGVLPSQAGSIRSVQQLGSGCFCKGQVRWGHEHFVFVGGVAAFSFQAFLILCALSESSRSLAEDWISIFLSNSISIAINKHLTAIPVWLFMTSHSRGVSQNALPISCCNQTFVTPWLLSQLILFMKTEKVLFFLLYFLALKFLTRRRTECGIRPCFGVFSFPVNLDIHAECSYCPEDSAHSRSHFYKHRIHLERGKSEINTLHSFLTLF